MIALPVGLYRFTRTFETTFQPNTGQRRFLDAGELLIVLYACTEGGTSPYRAVLMTEAGEIGRANISYSFWAHNFVMVV